jgi:hypothetical protein
MTKLSMMLAAVIAMKVTMIGGANYLPKGEEAKQVLVDTKDLWKCDKGTAPTLALHGSILAVECRPGATQAEAKK